MSGQAYLGGESWCYLAVNANEFTEGTDFFRETNTPLRFLTKDEIGSSSSTTQMVLAGNGNLGIGTISPAAKLDVVAPSGQNAISASSPLVGVYGLHTGGGTFPGVWGDSNSTSSSATAVRGIITSTAAGSGSTGVLGYNKSTTTNGYGVKGIHDGFGAGVYGVSSGGSGVYGLSTNGIGVFGKSTNGTYAGWFDGNVKVEGTATVEVLQITGADLAEKFPVSEKVRPGMVVAIDPDHPGQLCVARGSYNRCVAGVVSGANGLAAGAVLGNLPGNEDAPAIALTGRVWVYCDAREHAIAPGDLLTTAETPGHAMKVTDHLRAQGAMIGKAMTSLESGKGMVLVLVQPQ